MHGSLDVNGSPSVRGALKFFGIGGRGGGGAPLFFEVPSPARVSNNAAVLISCAVSALVGREAARLFVLCRNSLGMHRRRDLLSKDRARFESAVEYGRQCQDRLNSSAIV